MKSIAEISRKLSPLGWAYVAAVVCNIVALLLSPIIYGETRAYVEAWDFSWSNGEIDVLRTPVYPCLIGMAKMISADAWPYIVVAVQIVLFFISIGVMNRTLAAVFGPGRLCTLMLLIYSAYYPSAHFNCVISSESISLTMMVLLIYLVVDMLRRQRASTAVWISLLLMVMVMTRPTFLVIVAVFAMFWFISIACRRARRAATLALLSSVPAIGLCLGYSSAFEDAHGFRDISAVGAVNKYYMIRDSGVIFAEYLEGKEEIIETMEEYNALREGLTDHFERHYNLFDEIFSIPYKDMHEYTNKVLAAHPEMVLQFGWRNFVRCVTMPLYWKNWIIYLIVIAFTLMTLLRLIRKHIRPSALVVFLTIFEWCYIGMITFGAGSDWVRLLAPTFPVIVIMAGGLLGAAFPLINSRRSANNLQNASPSTK